MSVSAVKCNFSNLKYEQLLGEKYFIETCFTKKMDSYRSHNKLLDMLMTIKTNDTVGCSKDINNEESK